MTLKFVPLFGFPDAVIFQGPWPSPGVCADTTALQRLMVTLAASPVWVSALTNTLKANSHLLLLCTSTSIHSQCARVPARSPQSSVLQSFLFADPPAKHCLWGMNGEMSRSAHDWQSTALIPPPRSLLLCYGQFSLSTEVIIMFHNVPQNTDCSTLTYIWTVKFWRQACLLGYLQIFNAHRHYNNINTGQQPSQWHGTARERSSHEICEKFNILQRFLWWWINSTPSKPPSAVRISMSQSLQKNHFVFPWSLDVFPTNMM